MTWRRAARRYVVPFYATVGRCGSTSSKQWLSHCLTRKRRPFANSAKTLKEVRIHTSLFLAASYITDVAACTPHGPSLYC